MEFYPNLDVMQSLDIFREVCTFFSYLTYGCNSWSLISKENLTKNNVLPQECVLLKNLFDTIYTAITYS